MRMAFICVCGKLCTSRPGLTLHHQHCEAAKAAVARGEKPTQDSDIIEPHPKYCPEVQEFLDLADDIAFDANKAITQGNKSAGRRSRVNLIKLRELIIPIRDNILNKMKD